MTNHTTPTAPHASDSHRLNITDEERRKRLAIFTRAPGTVLVKLLSTQHLFEGDAKRAPFLDGFRRTDRNEGAIEQKHVDLAAERKVDAHAYGRERKTELNEAELPPTEAEEPKADTVKVADSGLCLFEKEGNVFAGDLVAEIFEAGYIVVDLHAFSQRDKGVVHVMTFKKRTSALEESLPIPPSAWRLLRESRFNNGTIWCNLKTGPDGKIVRLDTINLAKPYEVQDLGRHFHKEGNTYRLTEK